MTAPVSGRVYLGVNDDHLPDNNGEFVVNLGVRTRTSREAQRSIVPGRA